MTYQELVNEWAIECFGEEVTMDRIQRGKRFLEESLELVQACGLKQEDAHKLVDYVYGRPVGDISQEIGGVCTTLNTLATAFDENVADCQSQGLMYCWDNIDKIREKRLKKPDMTFSQPSS